MAKNLIKFFCVFAALQFLLAFVIFLFSKNNPTTHALFGMALGVFIFWIIIAGLLMKYFRDPIKNVVEKIPLDWRLKFIIFATLLALLEEAVTTTMTNTASFYGVTMAAVHITASSNYWDVVLTSSVVLFFPMFCLWAWLLSKYDFSPDEVFLMWGISGCLMETIYGGPQNIAEIGFWFLVYGLMVYLPAYCLPAGSILKKPKWWYYPLAMLGIILGGAIIGGSMAAIIKHIRVPHYFPGVK